MESTIPLNFHEYPLDEMQNRARTFADELRHRRTVRDFAPRPVPRALIDDCLRAAATAPSGANKQPWHFVVVSDAALKQQIRDAAEIEERDFYNQRAPAEWLTALAPLGTNADKPFLQDAACLIAIFAESYSQSAQGEKSKNYYVQESVGIATGFLIAALHHAGLATLTHTPSPMNFLNTLLHRPANERPFLLLVVGYPAPDAYVPNITKKDLNTIVTYF